MQQSMFRPQSLSYLIPLVIGTFLVFFSFLYPITTEAEIATTRDWIGLFPAGTSGASTCGTNGTTSCDSKPGTVNGNSWVYANSCTQTAGASPSLNNAGGCSFALSPVPTSGNYEFRLYANDQETPDALIAVSGATSANPTPSPGGGVNCPTQATNPRVQGGLITTPNISNNFGNPTATCIIGNPASFAPFKIPGYDDLKSLYFTQSKIDPSQKITLPGNQTQASTNSPIDLSNSPAPTPAPTTVIVSDNFDRADNLSTLGTSSTGQPWMVIKGTFGISNNQAYPVNGCPAPGYAVIDGGSADGTIQVTNIINPQDTRIPFRVIDENNLYWIETKGGGSYELDKMVGGAPSALGPLSGITAANGDTIKIVLNGSLIKVYINDVLGISIVDSSITSTKHGIGTWCTGTVRFDNFSISVPASSDRIYNITGDLTVNSNITVNTNGIIFVDGNLSINTDLTHNNEGAGLVFVVKGDVAIAPSVTRVDVVIISSGTIYTAGANCVINSVAATALVINGSLVSLDSQKPIRFCRTMLNNEQPAEKINQQPKYLVILRDLYSDTLQKWSEIP